MPKKKAVSNVIPDYSPEFKLRVVLQYLQNPEAAKRICNENRIQPELPTLWHQEFVARAGLIFGGAFARPQAPGSANHLIGEPGHEAPPSQAPESWGVRINYEKYGAIKSASSSDEPPAWLGPVERDGWQTKRGVVTWDDQAQKLEVFSAKSALELLPKYGKTNKWQTDGIPITHRMKTSPLPELSDAKPSRKKAGKRAAIKDVKSAPEPVEVVRFRLSPAAAPEFLAFLLEHGALLEQIAEEDLKEQQRYVANILDVLMRGASEASAKGIDLAARPLHWVREDLPEKFVCDLPPNRGTVELGERGWFWRSCIEQPDRFRRYSPHFLRLELSLTWTEQELIAIQKEEETAKLKPKPDLDGHAKPKIDPTQFRINPTALEPDRITYRVVMELEHTPDSFKTWEMSFGKPYRYDVKFPAPARIAHDLQLDATRVQVEELFGISNGEYRVYSATTFDRASVAMANARELWNKSGVHQLYKTGKVTRARFGIEELETHYCKWQGQLEDSQHAWPKQENRTDHVAGWALLATQAFALDVDGFRKRFGIPDDVVDDDYLLTVLHQRRAESKAVPANAREESKRWLKQHR